LLEFIQTHNADLDQLKRKLNSASGSNFASSPKTAEATSNGAATAGFEQELRDALLKAGLDARFDLFDLAPGDSGILMETNVPILFDTCKFTLADEHRKFLSQLAEFLKPYQVPPYRVSIDVEGFSDYRKIKGKKMTNIELSAKRAGAVVAELKKGGMKPSIFKITGMGEYKRCLEKSDRCRWLSRRADIAIHFVKK
jgi:outer membrane protein OmpA-like peptidoglycan-associated protein